MTTSLLTISLIVDNKSSAPNSSSSNVVRVASYDRRGSVVDSSSCGRKKWGRTEVIISLGCGSIRESIRRIYLESSGVLTFQCEYRGAILFEVSSRVSSVAVPEAATRSVQGVVEIKAHAGFLYRSSP